MTYPLDHTIRVAGAKLSYQWESLLLKFKHFVPTESKAYGKIAAIIYA